MMRKRMQQYKDKIDKRNLSPIQISQFNRHRTRVNSK